MKSKIMKYLLIAVVIAIMVKLGLMFDLLFDPVFMTGICIMVGATLINIGIDVFKKEAIQVPVKINKPNNL